ncbi:hypothetical protein Tsubulata_007932, partial [Turnera subulata]
EDLQRMKDAGLNAFRFSISWSRVIPGLTPFVTIFHWDTPQALEDKYGGFLSKNIADYRDYADFLFKTSGDRVRHWITLNEPWAYAAWGFDTGEFAPGRCSSWVRRACKAGNSATEPYIVAHNLLLSHATAVQLYRQKYNATQKGKIGFTLDSYWFEPYSSDIRDIDATKRSIDFHFGWFMDPATFGDYPRTMRDNVKERLPNFTIEESKMVKGSLDFVGAGLTWLRVVPYGIRYLLNYTKDTYRNPEIFVTENGKPKGSTSIIFTKTSCYLSTQCSYFSLWKY